MRQSSKVWLVTTKKKDRTSKPKAVTKLYLLIELGASSIINSADLVYYPLLFP